jgi:hypothetical protein
MNTWNEKPNKYPSGPLRAMDLLGLKIGDYYKNSHPIPNDPVVRYKLLSNDEYYEFYFFDKGCWNIEFELVSV